MADKTGIAWADATINPAYGCSPVSPACDNCYAARMAGRLGELTEGTHKDGKWTGKVNLHSERMEQALRWRKGRRIFVGSMTDLFHPAIPDQFLDEVFAVILANAYLERQARHQFIIMTKRPERMAAYFSQEPPTSMIRRWATAGDGWIIMDNPDIFFSEAVGGHCSGEWDEFGRLVGEYKDWGFANGLYPLPNTILMTTMEDQPRADERIPHLMELAGMGWRTGVSVEPMLGPVDLEQVQVEGGTIHALSGRIGVDGRGMAQCGKLSWIICGGESGPEARPMHPDRARGLRDQCAAAGVPYFFKQWGEWAERDEYVRRMGEDDPTLQQIGYRDQVQRMYFSEDTKLCMVRVGKHRAGRMLDGIEHNAFPEGWS